MIYSFVFEGGHLDGKTVLADFALPATSDSRAAQWTDSTLGGSVGLHLVVLGQARSDSSETGSTSTLTQVETDNQIYRVIYRDQHAGTVLIRCRHVPWTELPLEDTKRIVFTFEGGFKDGASDECANDLDISNPIFEEARSRFYVTENATVGKRFGTGSTENLQALRDGGPEAARDRGDSLHIYEVIRRSEDENELRIDCKFVKSA